MPAKRYRTKSTHVRSEITERMNAADLLMFGVRLVGRQPVGVVVIGDEDEVPVACGGSGVGTDGELPDRGHQAGPEWPAGAGFRLIGPFSTSRSSAASFQDTTCRSIFSNLQNRGAQPIGVDAPVCVFHAVHEEHRNLLPVLVVECGVVEDRAMLDDDRPPERARDRQQNPGPTPPPRGRRSLSQRRRDGTPACRSTSASPAVATERTPRPTSCCGAGDASCAAACDASSSPYACDAS